MTQLSHISVKPWSSYSAADYTPAQYKRACLVVRGDGSSKDDCKLPVKTPDGVLNRNGVHAAAAALAGARGGVELNAEERATAKRLLIGYYKKLNETPPPSLMHSAVDDILEHGMSAKVVKKISTKPTESGDVHHKFLARGVKPGPGTQFDHQGVTHEVVSVRTTSQNDVHVVTTKKAKKASVVKHTWESFELEQETTLEHHGVKGMKWGIRRPVDTSTGLVEGAPRGLRPRTSSADQIQQDRIAKKIATGGLHSLSNAEIQAFGRRLQLEQDLSRSLASLSAQEKAKSDGFIKSFVKKQGARQFDRVANKALDVAVETALEKAGIKLSGGTLKDFAEISKETKLPKAVSKSLTGDSIQKIAKRLEPKKGKG